MGKLTGNSGGGGQDVGNGLTLGDEKQKRETPEWATKLGAGMAAGGNAYDRQNAPHAGPQTNFDVSQAQLPPEYFQQQPYIQQAIQRYDPRQQGPVNPNAFYGG